MDRRTFLGAGVGAAAAAGTVFAAPAIPIIDTHIHLFDVDRPQGVPWPAKDSPIYKTASVERYRKLAVPHGIVGAIEVEASPWLEDNQWVLDVAAKDKLIVGTVGNLEPGKPGFAKNLERFHKNPLFRGIRVGNIWERNLRADVDSTAFISDIKMLPQADLSFDTANPNPVLIEAVVKLTDRVPNLRVIIDHLPQLTVPTEAAAKKKYFTDIEELAKRPQVYVKISQFFKRVDGKVPGDLGYYRATLDSIYNTFGEDRVIYGSDWPNIDLWRPYEDVMRVVKEYFSTKSRAAQEKYFWRNSVAAYKWKKRLPEQPSL